MHAYIYIHEKCHIYKMFVMWKMEHLHHRILFPVFPTYVQTPTPGNAPSSQNEHTPGSTWAQAVSSRAVLQKVSSLLKEQCYDLLPLCTTFSSLMSIFSCWTYSQLISIWSGSVGQANGKHLALESLHNLGVSWVSHYWAVPRGRTVRLNRGAQRTLLSEM